MTILPKELPRAGVPRARPPCRGSKSPGRSRAARLWLALALGTPAALARPHSALPACQVGARGSVPGEAAPAPHALSPAMAQLERDVASDAYRAICRTFIPTELAPELARLDQPDNADRFLAAHGGTEPVGRDAVLKAAHERRKAIEAAFIDVLRKEYSRLGRAEQLERDLEALRATWGRSAAASRGVAATASNLAIEAILPAPGAEKEWPCWRGPSLQGASTARGLPPLWSAPQAIRWKVEVPGEGNSSPIVWGEKVYLTTAFDRGRRRSVICFSARDGQRLWMADAPEAEPEGRVIAKNGYASATPATDGERVIAFFGNTGLVAFDLDGKLLWHRPFEPFDAMHGTGASPVLCRDLVILFQEQSDKPSIGIAVDKRSGEVRWKIAREPALGWATPVALRVGGRDELVYGGKGRLTAYDPATGGTLWSCEGPTVEVVPTVVFGGGLVFSASGRNGPTLAVRPGGEGDVTASHVA